MMKDRSPHCARDDENSVHGAQYTLRTLSKLKKDTKRGEHLSRFNKNFDK